MSSGLKSLKKNEILFREGDSSDAMYVIKSGKIAITKVKGTSDVMLAELGPGDMLGEMAFFDSRPRSAGAMALVDTVIIELPFKSLNAQFKTFPEWLKAIVRTVNNHLRNANQRIKNLEKSHEEETEFFAPHLITRLMAVLGFVAARFGEPAKGPSGGIDIPAGVLRRYTIQVFQLPTAKMQKLMEILESFQYVKVEELGEGKVRMTLFNLDFVMNFVDFYNDWIFKSEDKRTTVVEKELPAIKALLHYAKLEPKTDNGNVRVNLTVMQANALKDININFSADDVNSLIDKKLLLEKMSIDDGIACTFHFDDLALIAPYWELIHALKKIHRD